MLRAARCIPHKHRANSWGYWEDVDLIKSDVQIWLLISTHCVNVIRAHEHTHTNTHIYKISISEQLSGMCWCKHEIHFSPILCALCFVHWSTHCSSHFHVHLKIFFPGRQRKFQFHFWMPCNPKNMVVKLKQRNWIRQPLKPVFMLD